MKRLRLAAALLCALLVLAVPVMADGFGMGDFDSDTVNKNPQVDNPNEVTPTPSTEPPQEPTGDGAGNNAGDAVGTDGAGTENGNSSQLDDGLWGDWSNPSNIPGMEEPSEAQQELEEMKKTEETAGIGEITEEETTAVVGETETAGTTGTEDTAVVPEEIITEEYGIDKTKQGSEADTEGHQ